MPRVKNTYSPSELNGTPSGVGAALRRCWLSLTGGAGGCPRKRFFLCMLAAATVQAFASRLLVAGVIPATIITDSPWWASAIVTLFTLPTMVMSMVGGGLFVDNISLFFRKLGLWERIPMPEYLPGTDFVEETGLPAAYYFVGAVAVTVSGCIIFGLAWRRLRDAGYSPWHLLAGLWVGVMFGVYTLMGEGILGTCGDWFLYNLGNLWLLWLYCRPTLRIEPLRPENEES